MKIQNIVNKISRMRGKDIDKALFLNSWIYGSLALSVKDRQDDTTDETINRLNGACGHRDNLFREVAAALGWESRRIGFHDVPVQIAHVGTEILIDGEWRFFDATFGICMAAPDNKREILSIERARELYPDVLIMQASQKPYLGKWLLMVDRSYKPIKTKILLHPYGEWPLGEVDANYFFSKLILETEDWHYNSQFVITLEPGQHLRFDEAALQNNHLSFPYGESYVGYAHILGKYWGRGPVITKRFLFITDVPIDVRLSMKVRHLHPDNIHASMRPVVSDYSLEGATIKKEIRENVVTWSFVATPPMATVKIRANHDESAVIEALEVSVEEPRARVES